MEQTKTNLSDVTVSTRMFINGHGHQPRGFGWWLFQAGSGVQSYAKTGTYSTAKRFAVKSAARDGFTSVEVMP